MSKDKKSAEAAALEKALAFLAELESWSNRYIPRQVLDWDQRIQEIKDVAAGKAPAIDATTDAQG